MKNLSETFDHLKDTSNNLTEASKKLDPIFTERTAPWRRENAMETFDKAAADLRMALADFKKVSDTANHTLESANKVFRRRNAAWPSGCCSRIAKPRKISRR